MSETKNASQKSSKNNQNKNTQKIKKSQKFYYKKKRTSKKTKKQEPPKRLNELPVRISFLGGINEVGKNITLFEYEDDIIIVDCGLAFPDEDMLGIDLVIPDFTYVEKNADKIRGIVITHGHEDHIGSLAYLLRVVNVPVYSTRLTNGLIEGKLKPS